MARPKKARKICFEPNIAELIKPKNGRGCVELTVDEYESALQMEVARSTIAAIYENARYKISDSLVNGKSIKISGGDYVLCQNSTHCCGRCGANTCGRCNHGACERCTGVFHPKGKECDILN